MDLCLYCQAGHSCPFRTLPDEERLRLRDGVLRKVFGRSQRVVRQGDEVTGVYVVQSGVVRLSHVTADGKEVVVRLLGPAGLIGLTETLTGRPYLLSAEAVDASRLELLPRSVVVDVLGRHPDVAAALLGWLASELHRTVEAWCESTAGTPLTERLWHNLREMGAACGRATEEGVALSRHLTVRDLAHGLGCSRQWTHKLLSELEDEGRLKRHGRQIILLPAVSGAGVRAGPLVRRPPCPAIASA